MKNILYKIYYGEQLVYLGRTHQELTDRIRCHLFKAPRIKVLDIQFITKIEYAEFSTEADMFLYEIYYINKYKPPFNCDDKAIDDLTVELPAVIFNEWKTPLWNKWKKEILDKAEYNKIKEEKTKKWSYQREIVDRKFQDGKINKKQMKEELDKIDKEEGEFLYKHADISFERYCEMVKPEKITGR